MDRSETKNGAGQTGLGRDVAHVACVEEGGMELTHSSAWRMTRPVIASMSILRQSMSTIKILEVIDNTPPFL